MTPKKGALGRNILLDTLGKTKPEASVSEPKEGIVLMVSIRLTEAMATS